MINYQRFVMYFREIERDFNEAGLKNINIHMITKKRLDFYKRVGMDTEDKISQYEHKTTKNLMADLNLTLELVHIFEIDTIIKRYLILNRPPQTKEFYRKVTLPFKNIFLDIEITPEDYEIGVDKILGIMISEAPIIEQKEDTQGIKFKTIGMGYKVHYLCEDKDNLFIDEFKIIIDKTNIPIFYDDRKTLKFLREFIMNLLIFINDQEVQIIGRKRSSKNIERRAKEGKMPLPDSSVVRLTGTLKKYIGSLSEGLAGRKYHFRFWVRGHMRYLKADRYKQKKGQWIKIEPFIKGEGVLVKRVYRITEDKEDERIKELKEQNLFYEDIEPLKKPLHEILEKDRMKKAESYHKEKSQ